ncbi:MAG: hypothetical protein ACRDYC_01815 [Acidimicrobiales bacterium]
MSVYDLADAGLGSFDLVVLGSLLVHLRDPVRALDAVRRVTRGHLLAIEYLHTPLQILMGRQPLALLRGVGVDFQWWLPTDGAVRQMLSVGGFEVERVSKPFLLRLTSPPPAPPTLRGRARAQAVRLGNGILTGDWRAQGHLHRAYLCRPRF